MGHFKETKPEEFWKALQDHLGYSDEELEHFKKNPKKVRTAPLMASPKIRNSTLVIEVVESHGCAEGMKPGDKLYFNGVALLDPGRSSPWCAYAMAYIGVKAELCHNLLLQGIDPNEMYGEYFSCSDCGSNYGWGQVIMRSYVIEENDKEK